MENTIMKKSYQKPDIEVVSLEQHNPILAGSPNVDSPDLTVGEGSSKNPTSRQGRGFLFDED